MKIKNIKYVRNNYALNVAVSFKIIMTTSVTRPCFTIQYQTYKTDSKTKTDFFFGLRPVLSQDRRSRTTSLVHTAYRAVVCCRCRWCCWLVTITWFSTSAPPGSECSSAVSHRPRYHWPRATLTSPVRHSFISRCTELNDLWCHEVANLPTVLHIFETA